MKKTKIILAAIALCCASQVSAQDGSGDLEKRFARIDTNDDDSISLEELQTQNAKRAEKKGVETRDMTARFEKMDTDANGLVSMEEFKSFREAMEEKKKKKKES